MPGQTWRPGGSVGTPGNPWTRADSAPCLRTSRRWSNRGASNLYGSHPFYLERRADGDAHGIFLLSTNGMDVVFAPGTLTFKIIGGIIDLFAFVGPTPGDVIAQYTRVVGRPHMVPYWVRQRAQWRRAAITHAHLSRPRSLTWCAPPTICHGSCCAGRRTGAGLPSVSAPRYADRPTPRPTIWLTGTRLPDGPRSWARRDRALQMPLGLPEPGRRQRGRDAVQGQQHPAGHDVDGAGLASPVRRASPRRELTRGPMPPRLAAGCRRLQDIDYMERYRDFTFSPTRFPRADVTAFSQQLRAQGQRYMLIADPAISNKDEGYGPYIRGTEMGVWILNANGTAPQTGIVWPGSVPRSSSGETRPLFFFFFC